MMINLPTAPKNPHFNNHYFLATEKLTKQTPKVKISFSCQRINRILFPDLYMKLWSGTAQSAEVTSPKPTDPMAPSHPLPSPPSGPDGIKSWGGVSFQSLLCPGQEHPSPWSQGTSILPTNLTMENDKVLCSYRISFLRNNTSDVR